MGSFGARLRFAARVLARGVPRPPEGDLLVPIGDPWADADHAEARQESALALFDDDVCGFVLILARRHDVAPFVELERACVIPVTWWPQVARLINKAAAGART